jgi:hypothetical protein
MAILIDRPDDYDPYYPNYKEDIYDEYGFVQTKEVLDIIGNAKPKFGEDRDYLIELANNQRLRQNPLITKFGPDALHNRCPFCDIGQDGGMTLVRHMCQSHDLESHRANQIVDLMYAMETAQINALGYPFSEEIYLGFLKNLKDTIPHTNNPVFTDFLNQFDEAVSKVILK